jgi:hypothetical protein
MILSPPNRIDPMPESGIKIRDITFNGFREKTISRPDGGLF